MEDLNVLVVIVFILAAVLVYQNSRIRFLENLLKDSDYLKSRAEFETKESQDGSYFQDEVIKKLLKEFSEKDLARIQKKMEQNVRRISNMEIQDQEQLKEMDAYRLCCRYVAFELRERNENAMSVN